MNGELRGWLVGWLVRFGWVFFFFPRGFFCCCCCYYDYYDDYPQRWSFSFTLLDFFIKGGWLVFAYPYLPTCLLTSAAVQYTAPAGLLSRNRIGLILRMGLGGWVLLLTLLLSAAVFLLL